MRLPSASSASIQEAISRAQQHLIRLQSEDGYWLGELVVDATLCADYVLFMHWLGRSGTRARAQVR